MLRSLYSGISGLRAHQTMLDVTGNNIANVNTAGFKKSSTQFQDTLSQVLRNSGLPQEQAGGTNPAQVGLGVQVAGIRTSFAQGSAQSTGNPTDLMLDGDGFFVVSKGGQTTYTRAGAFSFDSAGRLTTADGALVQGWSAVNGVVNTGGPLGGIRLPVDATSPAVATTGAHVKGNLPGNVADGESIVREIEVYDETGASTQLTLTFTKTAAGWDVTDGAVTTSLAFTDGKQTAASSLTTADGITVDLSDITGYADLRTVVIDNQNGSAAGTLTSYQIGADGALVGAFSNGAIQVLAQVAVANFDNPEGLEKVGSSQYRVGVNSGVPVIGVPGEDGAARLISGALEMSNVDLSEEFTNLIVAQRGFQSNARVITTSDEVLQEVTNLKR